MEKKKVANMKAGIHKFFLFSIMMLVLLNTVLMLDTTRIVHGASEDIAFSDQYIIITVQLIELCTTAAVGSMLAYFALFAYLKILENEPRKTEMLIEKSKTGG